MSNNILFGAMVWSGTYNDLPAVIGSYYGGASLYVFENGKWKIAAKGDCTNDVIPHKCERCGTELPLLIKGAKE